MTKRIVPIRYTSRDFDSIKTDLINYSKRYYPDTNQDFNEGSFGSLMVDTVAYVGDILSYYLDFQANETFLDTAIGFENVLKLGSGVGFKRKGPLAATGVVTIYVSVPANTTGTGPNPNYFPIIKRGSIFRSTNGLSYTLIDDVVVTENNSEIRKSKISDNAPYEYVIKTFGKVISGEVETTSYSIGEFQKFRKLKIGDTTVSEIVSVIDSDGNEYFEVDYLTQNVIYRIVPNMNSDKEMTPNLLKPYNVVRKFVSHYETDGTYIQFGGTGEGDTTDNKKLTEPASVVINRYGRDYLTDETFDPAILANTEKLGVAPYNTTLTVVIRKNRFQANSAPAFSINSVSNVSLAFQNQQNLDVNVRYTMSTTVRVINELPIIGQNTTSDTDSSEIKARIAGAASAQNRAVTEQDYQSICYNMPSKFGSIKRVRIIRDADELKRNLNLYVISEDSNSYLVNANQTTKNNLKNWINKNKIINDTIDILDAKIVNFGIYFTVMVDTNYSKYDVLTNALMAVKEEFSVKLDIGESILLTRVYDALKRVDGLIDVREVKMVQKTTVDNASYSSYTYNFDDNLTPDGKFLKVPKNVILELKFPDIDIEGKIV